MIVPKLPFLICTPLFVGQIKSDLLNKITSTFDPCNTSQTSEEHIINLKTEAVMSYCSLKYCTNKYKFLSILGRGTQFVFVEQWASSSMKYWVPKVLDIRNTQLLRLCLLPEMPAVMQYYCTTCDCVCHKCVWWRTSALLALFYC